MRRLSGFLPLRKTASTVRVRSGARTLWESPVLEAAAVKLTADVHRVNRGRPLVLRFNYSRAFEGASMQIFYEWAPGRSQVIAAIEPSRRFAVNLASLPGGPSCRLWAHYSNGMRSAMAASARFKLPLLPAILTIDQPKRGTKLGPGQPLEMEGQVIVPQSIDNVPHQAELVWLLDGKRVGVGPVACVLQPSVGKHTVELVHRKSRIATSIVVIARRARNPLPAFLWDEEEFPSDHRGT